VPKSRAEIDRPLPTVLDGREGKMILRLGRSLSCNSKSFSLKTGNLTRLSLSTRSFNSKQLRALVVLSRRALAGHAPPGLLPPSQSQQGPNSSPRFWSLSWTLCFGWWRMKQSFVDSALFLDACDGRVKSTPGYCYSTISWHLVSPDPSREERVR
jgi:hypothetical protein